MENPLSKKFAEQFELTVWWINDTLSRLSDNDFNLELFPGKNHGVWILGHLVVSDDDFSKFMGRGELLFPEYSEIFRQGSKVLPVENYPSVSELKKCWDDVCQKNRKIYLDLKDFEFDEPHAMLEDAEKDFFKTKGKVIMTWQLHQMYHNGQLAALLSKAGKSKF